MTPQQIMLVRSSFANVRPIADTAAWLFYTRLFELDPELRSLFHGDMREQGRKLMSMIALAVEQLDRPDALLPAVRRLGQRHQSYGVVARHYDTVGAALLWTLEHGLGDQWTPAVRDAWTAAYQVLSATMLTAEPVAA